MKKVYSMIALASIALTGPSMAKPLDLSQVADDANWLMHVDFDSARKSKIGSFIMDKIDGNSEAADRMDELQETFGVDPEGFSSLTMFGTGEIEKGIAIMTGLYVLAHLHKPGSETFACLVVGPAFAYLTLETGTIWAVFILHTLIGITNENLAAKFNPEFQTSTIP